MESLWAPLASELIALDAAGTDAVVDAGRLGASVRSDPAAAAGGRGGAGHAHQLGGGERGPLAAAALRADLDSAGTGADALGLLLVGEGQPYTEAESARS